MAEVPRVDSHIHFWKLARGDYDWLTPEAGPIYRDFGPEDLKPHREATGVEKVVIVQAAATVAETRFMLDIAHEAEEVAGVVGWVDIEDSKASDMLAELKRDSYFKGIRPMIQFIDQVDWMLGERLTPAFRALAELDLTFDCLVGSEHLANLLTLLTRHSDLRALINHCGQPKIAAGEFDTWAADMEALAHNTKAYCKFSGMTSQAGRGWRVETLRPYAEHLLECFGPARLIWGSDWPVLTTTATYEDWWAAANALLARTSESDKAKILGGNAREFYRL